MRRYLGFTLIDTLLYIVLLTAGMFVLVTVFLSGLRTHKLIADQQLLVANKQTAELTLFARLGEASQITIPASGTATELIIDSPESAENPVHFYVTDGVLFVAVGTQAPAVLTSSRVQVTAFSVTRLEGTPASIFVDLSYQTAAVAGVVSRLNSSFTYTLRYE